MGWDGMGWDGMGWDGIYSKGWLRAGGRGGGRRTYAEGEGEGEIVRLC